MTKQLDVTASALTRLASGEASLSEGIGGVKEALEGVLPGKAGIVMDRVADGARAIEDFKCAGEGAECLGGAVELLDQLSGGKVGSKGVELGKSIGGFLSNPDDPDARSGLLKSAVGGLVKDKRQADAIQGLGEALLNDKPINLETAWDVAEQVLPPGAKNAVN